MADNFTANPGTGGSVFAADDLSSVFYPRVKRSVGRDGQAADALTPYKLVSAASTNATSVKSSAGTVHMVSAQNANASPRYLKLYNKASAPTVGTDTPVQVYMLPAGGGIALEIGSGLDFSTGIALALTTGAADNDTGAVAANDIVVNLGYV